jgi:chromosome segregation ATPase
MEEETNLTYEERMKERKSVLLRINEAKSELKELNRKISDLETQLRNLNKEKRNFEIKILNLEEELIRKGIAVPEERNYEIENGLLGAKRDLNLKLIKDLKEEDIPQVFILIFSFLLFNFELRYSE